MSVKFLTKAKKQTALILMILLFSSISSEALAASIIVDSNDDDGNFTNGTCSLREAIFSVNDGGDPNIDNCTPGSSGAALDSVTFSGPMTITLNSVLPQITSPVDLNGDVNSDNSPDVTIDANNLGRALDLNPNASLSTTANVNGFSFLNGSSVGDGGTIAARSLAQLNLTNTEISSSNAGGNGGAIYLEQQADFTPNNVTIDGSNAGQDGGAIYVTGDSTMQTNDLHITNSNAANNGGAIYLGDAGGTSTINFDNSTINRDGIGISTAGGDGGGIYVEDNVNFNINSSGLTNGQINNSSAHLNGGGIYFKSGVLPYVHDIRNLQMNGNYTEQNGGGIDVGQKHQLALDNINVINNVADDSGGAIHFEGEVIPGDADNSTITNSNFINNTAFNGGGAIKQNQYRSTTVDNSTFDNNLVTSGDGGAMSVLDANSNIDNSTFTLNSSSNGNGGAIDTGASIGIGSNLVISNTLFDQNTANTYGSVAFINSDSSLTYTGGAVNKFILNDAGSGGTIYSAGAAININNALFVENNGVNTANSAVIRANGGTVSFTDTEASNHNASTLFDFTDVSDAQMHHVHIHDNSSAFNGIVWYNDGDILANSSNLIIDNGSIFENNISFDGSTINAFIDNINIDNTIIRNNFALAPGQSGGLLAQVSNADLNAVDFDSNQGDDTGGATITATNSFNLTNSIFQNNSGNNIAGGLSLNLPSGGVISALEMFNNTGLAYGGMSIVSNILTTIDKSSFNANNSSNVGGLALEGLFDLTNNTISGNFGDHVGGILISDFTSSIATVVNLINNTVVLNGSIVDAVNNAGGLVVEDIVNPVSATMVNTILSQNTTAGPSSSDDCLINGTASFTSLGNSIVSNTTNCNYTAGPDDIQNVPSGINVTLGYNGGTTRSHLLNTGSPAIDAGNDLSAPVDDQRNQIRPIGLHTDIGAIEMLDNTAPILSEVTTVITPSTNTTPSYTFNSTETGTISYGGACSSLTTSALAANNTIIFNPLSPGTYNSCTITVTDASANISLPLLLTSFTITAPPLVPGGGGGGGAGGPYGQTTCSGQDCLTHPNNNIITNPPTNNNVVTPNQTNNPNNNSENLYQITPVAPVNPIVPVTAQNSIPASNINNASVNNRSINRLITDKVLPNIPVETAETFVKPDQTETVSVEPQPLYTKDLFIITPENEQKSADHTPFITGQGVSNRDTEIYLFHSADFDQIRKIIELELEQSNYSLNSKERDEYFKIMFTNSVINILQKFLNHQLDEEKPEEAVFINRVLKLGNTNTGNNGVFLLDSDKDLQDDKYLVMALHPGQNKLNPLYSSERLFTVDSTLNVLTPEITSIGGRNLSMQDLLSDLRIEISPGNLRPVLVGKIKESSKIVANWQSDVVTSALLVDSLDQEFRITAPNPLEPGEHAVYVTAYRRSDNAQSDTIKILFNLKEASPLDVVINNWIYLASGTLLLLLSSIIWFVKRRNSIKTEQ